MRVGGRTKSTHPEAMALRGMPSCGADSRSWTKTMPPSALIALAPSVPSEPVPERITPTALPPRASASVRRNESIGRCRPPVVTRGTSFSTSPSMATSFRPGVT